MVNCSTRLLNRLLAGRCVLCQQSLRQEPDICEACVADLPWIGHCCQICALPLTDSNQPVCGECLSAPPAFSRTVACWRYETPVAQLISQFKYRRRYAYGQSLCQLAEKSIVSAYTQSDTDSSHGYPDALIPVPMHWFRRIRRGFNHSELLAQRMGQPLGLTIEHVIKRHQFTASQQSLNAAERKQNLKRAFALTATGMQKIQGKRLTLVDDVMTTGATARELSKLLINAGASEVHVWVLARTPH